MVVLGGNVVNVGNIHESRGTLIRRNGSVIVGNILIEGIWSNKWEH
jgi:hypothetical protein